MLKHKAAGAEEVKPSVYRHANKSVLELVGNTPLVRINNITKDLPKGVEIYAKLESYNPGGSVKDRAALKMVEDAEKGRTPYQRQDNPRFEFGQYRNSLRVDRLGKGL